MFAKPEVGKTVTVTTDWTDYFRTYSKLSQLLSSIQKDTGEVVASESFDDPYSFRLYTGDATYPVSVIPLLRVSALDYSDGTEAEERDTPIEDDVETWLIDGSGEQKYVVTRRITMWSCECKGYQFRRACRHINICKQLKLDKS